MNRRYHRPFKICALLLMVGITSLATGCFGPSMRPGDGDYWWDDQRQERLDNYQLPQDPASDEEPAPGSKPAPAVPEKPPRDPSRESTANAIPETN